MGMFDTVVIEGLKLPKLPNDINKFLKENNANTPTSYQTKDLDNVLSTFTINSKGQIYVTEYKPTGKKIPYNPPFKNWVDNRSFLEKIYNKFFVERKLDKKYGKLKFVDETKPVQVRAKTTNTFIIGSYDEVGGRYLSLDFKLVAVNGIVKKVDLVNAEIESVKSAKDRKKQNEEFDKKIAKSIEDRKNFKSKWYYPILKEIYNPFVFFSSKIIRFVCNYIISSTNRWHGV